MAYQSLYRRYRSRTFAEVLGQPHVTMALRTAVAEGRHGHAYLFSGPRGTGKTSTARVLAKALNCQDLQGGEPCCVCDSCKAIEEGTSFDLHELDAASHNKVDDIRDLISKVHLGSPGRTKVYILDEVHMLSSGAENALLKTLEEPPDHVVFVLATTEPQKVVPTIRSRSQHFEFHLLPAEVLAGHVRNVITNADLSVADDAIEYVLRQGGGSARDTLSALDLVAAAGGVPRGDDVAASVLRAIAEHNPGHAIAAIQEGLELGREPRTIGEDALDLLRNAFLATMGASLAHLNDQAQELAQELGESLGPATLTRTLETIGSALIEMRQAPDPRVPLEVALLRLTRDDLDNSADALVARIEQLERQVAELSAGRPVTQATPSAPADGGPADGGPADGVEQPAPAPTAEAAPPAAPAGPPARRPTIARPTPSTAPAAKSAETPAPRPPRRLTSVPSGGRARPPANDAPAPPAGDGSAQPTGASPADQAPTPPPAAPSPAAPAPAPAAAAGPLDHGSAVDALATRLDDLSQRVRVRFKGGRVLAVEGTTIKFGTPNPIHRDRCLDVKADVETALSSHFGHPVTIDVVIDGDSAAPSDPAKIAPRPAPPSNGGVDEEADIGPVEELANATDQSASGVDRLTKAFPGSKVVDTPPE